jgi:hypothetical protein
MMVSAGYSNVNWHTKYQRGYFDKDGNPAGYSGERKRLKQAKKELVILGFDIVRMI